MSVALAVNVMPTTAKTGIVVVPASYHSATQPPVAGQSFMLTLMQQGGSWDDKYHHAVEMLSRDRGRFIADLLC